MTVKPYRPWRMLAPLATVFILFGLWSGYWFFAQAAAKSYVENYRAKLASKGVTLACESEDWGGYPFRFEFSCGKPLVQIPGERSAQSSALLIVGQAYNPMHVIALVDGPTSVHPRSGAPVEFTHNRGVASLVFAGGELPRISAEVSNLAAVNQFSAKDAQIHIRPTGDGGAEFAIAVEAGELNSPDKPPLRLENGQVLARLKPNRDVEIQSVTVQQGAQKISATGTLRLDSEHRIAGIVTAETNDLNGLIAALDPHLSLSDRERAAIQTLLGLLGKEGKADIIAKDGELFVGPVKVGDLTPLY